MAKKDLVEEILSLSDTYKQEELENLKANELEMILKLTKDVAEKVKAEAQASTEKTVSIEDVSVASSTTPLQRLSQSNIDKSVLVPVMNITHGSLVYQSRKTGMEIKFERYGDIEYMEIGELLTMRSSQRRFLDEPWILILDDETVQYLGLDKLYKRLVNPDNIDQIFNFSIEKFKDVIQSAPRGYSQLIISRAKAKMKDGSLDSVAKIKALEERYKVELQK